MLGKVGSAWSLYRNASANRPLGGGKGAFLRVYPLRGIFQRVSHQRFSHISRMLWLLWPLVVCYTWNSVYHVIENVQWHTKQMFCICFLCTCRFRVCCKQSSFHDLLFSSSKAVVILLFDCTLINEVKQMKDIAVSEFLYFHMLWIWLIVLLGYNEHVQYEHILKNTISYIVFCDQWSLTYDIITFLVPVAVKLLNEVSRFESYAFSAHLALWDREISTDSTLQNLSRCSGLSVCCSPTVSWVFWAFYLFDLPLEKYAYSDVGHVHEFD